VYYVCRQTITSIRLLEMKNISQLLFSTSLLLILNGCVAGQVAGRIANAIPDESKLLFLVALIIGVFILFYFSFRNKDDRDLEKETNKPVVAKKKTNAVSKQKENNKRETDKFYKQKDFNKSIKPKKRWISNLTHIDRSSFKNEKEYQKVWCKEIGLDFVEMTKLREIEPYEGALNKVLRCYENNVLIPRTDLEWVFNAKGQGLIRDYVLGCSIPNHQGFFKSKSRLQNRTEFTFSQDIDLKKINYGLGFSISYLHDYLPKATTQSSIDSSRILEFKDGEDEAVNFYYENLKDIFQPDVLICCVPSSQTGSWGSGFPKLLSKLNGSFVPLETQFSLLKRTMTIQKKSLGGERSLDKELNTTEITDQDLMRDRRVVIIDDVSTTGTSLYAASLKLWNAGANCVAAVALSQTRKIS
jgi:hypothetical protein